MTDEVVWGSYWRREFNIYKVINVWRSMDDQPQRAPRAQHGVVISVSSASSVVFRTDSREAAWRLQRRA